LLRANREIPENLSGISLICSSKRITKRMATPGFTGVTVRLVMRLGFFVFFSVCVRLARQGHGESGTSATTSSPLRVRLPIKNLYSYLTFLMYTPSIQLYIFLTFFPCLHLPPKKLHNFKNNFRQSYHATSPPPPPNICTILCQLFHVTSPPKDFTILVPTLSMCDSPRDICASMLAPFPL